jgi:exopolysaccharide production protein ExoZ
MKLYSLQFLRFIASLFVISFHLRLMQSGYKGVDVFFVMSGFVMYYSTFLVAKKNAVTFFVNRLTKIYLLYWIALLLCYFVTPYRINYSFIKTALLLPGHFTVLRVSWSLAFELYFYFLFGGIIYFLPIKNYKVIFLPLLVVSTVITILNTTSFSFKGHLINALLGENCWEFLLGIAGAYLFANKSQTINKNMLLIIVVIAGLALTFIGIHYGNPFSYLVYGSLSFFIITCITILEKKIFFSPGTQRIINMLGDSSYAIYLIGPIIINVINPASFIVKIFSVLLLVMISILINKFVENKLLKLSRKALLRLIH